VKRLRLVAATALLAASLVLYPFAHATPNRTMVFLAATSAVALALALIASRWELAAAGLCLLVLEYAAGMAAAGHIDPLAPLFATGLLSLAELIDFSFSVRRGRVLEPGAAGARARTWLQTALVGALSAAVALAAATAVEVTNLAAVPAAAALGLAGLALIVLLARSRVDV
jgi:hypothetical protein